ncbi:MAG: dTDP-4-dehydrorhamnose reductase [Acidobacteria bacterium]|nr:dTDP-4-dehydrorhamnose reductase [Acidobacteriota bacterium]
MRILVTGACGQLGAAVAAECGRAHEVAALGRGDLDVTDDAAVEAAVAGFGPDAIVNGAAYTDVDGAEDHPIDALNANAFAVRALASAARACGAALVHYSTDFVFDGEAGRPYTEADAPAPRSVYAMSKLLGEWFAADAARHYVLRVESLFGRAPGARPAKGSVAGILRALAAGEAAKVFEDRTISPTYVIDAARATRHLIERGAPSGVYHCVNSGSATWLELARELARGLGVEPKLVAVRMSDMALRAQRPRYCALANAKLAAEGFAMPAWQDALARYLETVRHDLAREAAGRQA